MHASRALLGFWLSETSVRFHRLRDKGTRPGAARRDCTNIVSCVLLNYECFHSCHSVCSCGSALS